VRRVGPEERLLVAGVLAVLLLGASVAAVWAADPSTTPGTGGDPRSSGQGPGLVGDPAFALGAVLVVGLLSVVLTVAWVRLTGPGPGPPRR
jgi:hypothetical protein